MVCGLGSLGTDDLRPSKLQRPPTAEDEKTTAKTPRQKYVRKQNAEKEQEVHEKAQTKHLRPHPMSIEG